MEGADGEHPLTSGQPLCEFQQAVVCHRPPSELLYVSHGLKTVTPAAS